MADLIVPFPFGQNCPRMITMATIPMTTFSIGFLHCKRSPVFVDLIDYRFKLLDALSSSLLLSLLRFKFVFRGAYTTIPFPAVFFAFLLFCNIFNISLSYYFNVTNYLSFCLSPYRDDFLGSLSDFFLLFKSVFPNLQSITLFVVIFIFYLSVYCIFVLSFSPAIVFTIRCNISRFMLMSYHLTNIHVKYLLVLIIPL